MSDRTVTTTLVARVNQHISGMNQAAQANRAFGTSAAQASMVHDKAVKGVIATTDDLRQRSRVAFRGLAQIGGQAGMFSPLTGSIGAASEAFALMEEHGKSVGTVMMGTGAAATAAGLLMVQASAADVQQHALLKTAVEATGHSYEEYAKRVESTVGTQEHYGHTVSDTENAIRNLTQALGDPTKAMDRMGLVADLAASRHTSLADASNLVTRVLAGKGGRTLAQYGIVMEHTKDKTKAGADAADQLARKLSGQASAAADTFAGKMDAAKVRVEDFANAIGAKVGPVLTVLGPLMAGVGAIAQVAMGVKGSMAARALAVSESEAAAAAGVLAREEQLAAVTTTEFAAAATRATAANEALGASSVSAGGKMAGLAKGAGAIGVAAVAAGLAVAGLSKLQDSNVKYSRGTDKMTQSLLTLNRTGNVSGDLSRVFGGNLGQLASDLKRMDSPTGYQGFNDKMNSIFTLGKYKDTGLREAIADYKALDASVTELVTSGHPDEAAKALANLGVTSATAAKHLPNYSAALDKIKTSSMLLNPALQGTQTALQKVTANLDQYAKAMYGASTAAGNAETANLNWLDTLAKAPAALKDDLNWLRRNHKALDDTTQAGRNVSATLVDLSGKAVAHAEAVATQTGQVRSGVLAFAAEKSALEKSLKAHGELTPAMQALINRYFVINPLVLAAAAAAQKHADKVKALQDRIAALTDKSVKVGQTGAEAATKQVYALLRQLQGLQGKTITISAQGQAIIATGFYAGKHIPLAEGGEVPMLPGSVRGKDSVAAMLTPHEFIIRADGSNLAEAFAHFAKGYAGGGQVLADNALPVFGRLADAVFTPLRNAVLGALIPAGIPAGIGGSVGGGAARWAPQVITVLNMMHQPLTLLAGVLRRINFESGGNPNAINLTDSNALAGHPSQGLMQDIPSTFAAYAGPYARLGITDPFANIYASLHYALSRYGSIAAIDPLVRPQGYDSGGYLERGVTVAVNRTGQRERVLDAAETRDYDAPRRFARGGGWHGGTVGGDGAAMPAIVVHMAATKMSESALTHAVRLAHQRSRVGLPR